MEKAISKAIEGGYKYNAPWEFGTKDLYDASILLDPLFWQALGKALGWRGADHDKTAGWFDEWHNLIDYLASGKDADSFFQNLLSDNK